MSSKIFTIAVVLLPILSVYISPINGIDLGTFCLLLLLPVLLGGILKCNKIKMKLPLSMLLLILYISFGSLISYVISIPPNFVLVLSRMGKFIIVLLIVFIIGKGQYFDYQLAKRILKITVLAAVSYIIIQSVMFYMSGRLLPSVPFNLIRSEEYANIDYLRGASVFYRPTSFFLEPAHFAQYVIVYLIYSLFGDYKENQTKLKIAVFITVGLFLSTSGQGILLSLLVWGFWLFSQLIKSSIDRKIKLVILGVLVCTIVLPAVFQTEILSTSIDRVITNSGSLGAATEGRLFSYDYFNDLPMLQKIIGTGYGNVPAGVYLNSVAYTLYCNGIIGMLFVGMLFYDAFVHTRYYHKYLCIIYALLIFGSSTFTASGIAFYFMFIYSGYIKDRTFGRIQSQ